jgi:DNA-binding protein HU-beta
VVTIWHEFSLATSRRFERASARQHGECLLLSRKHSLISEIAFPGGGAVNKSGLIDAVSKTTSLAKREAEQAVNAVVHVVASEVRSGRRVVVAGFGSFNPTHRGARMGRNPQTGEPVRIAATKGVRFAASALLKDALNRKAALPVVKAPAAMKKTAKKGTKRTVTAGKRTADTAARRVTKRPGARASQRTTRRGTTIVGRSPARRAAKRAPASKSAKQSARTAAGRSPARTAAQRPAGRP